MAGAHPVLETRGLTIRFGGHVAVDAVSCSFQPGSLTAIAAAMPPAVKKSGGESKRRLCSATSQSFTLFLGCS